MTEIYGTAFLVAYGDAPPRIWEAAIAGLTDAECRDGISRLAHEKRQYPANLTEFVEACKRKPIRYLGGQPTSPGALRRLEAPPADPKKVAAHIANMRRTVGAALKA